MESLAETIRHIPLFSGLSREDLARIVGKLREERFAAGQTIVKQGDVGDALYVIQSGAAEVVLEHDGLRVESVAILGPYECFGEMSLFTGQRRSATVLALIDSVVLKLSKETWEELLARHASLGLHFCKVLSQRLAETDRDISIGRGAFYLAMEDFFAGQPVQIQDFLLRTSILKTLDAGAIESVLSISDANQLLTSLSLNHPVFLRIAKDGNYEYLDYLRDFLSSKQEQKIGRKERDALHLRFASYLSNHAKWAAAIYHYVKAEAWKEAIEQIEAHGDELLESESPREILDWLDGLPLRVVSGRGHIAGLRAKAYVKIGDLEKAIKCYQEFLTQKQATVVETLETAGYYQELARLYHKKGETGEALGCLRLGLGILEEGSVNTDVVQAIRSIGALQQKGGFPEAAFRWGEKALKSVSQLGTQAGLALLPRDKKWLGLILAFAVAWGLWQMPPLPPLNQRGMHFLATLTVGLILWISDIFQDYMVALMLLLAWVLFDIVPAEMAMTGFSKSSWFFVLGVLGMGAALTKSGLVYRVALQILHRIPHDYRVYSLLLSSSGLLVTPLLPKSQGRIAVISPMCQAISDSLGFKSRSNGSAALALSAYIGFTQTSFMFLTGGTACLIGWNLLPEPARSEFGWGTWTVAALPAGLFLLLFLFAVIHFLFPREQQDKAGFSPEILKTQLEVLGPLTGSEWLSLTVFALAILGWLGKPIHGISEAWVALGALLVFFVTGILDKNGLKNNIDWGYLLFLGVVSSLAVIMPHLKIDRWLMDSLDPILSAVSFHPVFFLMMVTLLVYFARLFLSKTTTVILFILAMTSWAQDMGIHPGVLLLTILLAIECWFLPYQTDSYQIAYYSTEERAFSHAQARKLMFVKFLGSFVAVLISVPYWRMLGFIK